MTTATIKSQDQFNDIVTALKVAADAYYNGGESALSDEKYDAALDAVADALEANPEWSTPAAAALIGSVAGGVSGDVDKMVTHAVPMLSLSKTTDIAGVKKFMERVGNTGVVIEPKVDGIACSIRYSGGKRTVIATRGDGVNGEDITDRVNAITINSLPDTVADDSEFEVRGELYMSPADFEFSNKSRVEAGKTAFANPRNATSGTVMRETITYDTRLSFALYDVVGFEGDSYTSRVDRVAQMGFQPARDLMPTRLTKRFTSGVDLAEAVEVFGALRTDGDIPAPTDGCVIKVDSSAERDRLGSGSRHPHWAIAFKYDALRGTTTLREIERAVGRTGNVSYTAILDPVFIDGSTVTRATLHNADYIADRDLRIGDTVVVFKANDIIPRVDSQVTPSNVERGARYVAPTTCPQCGEELNRAGAIWQCQTPSCGIVNLVSYAVSRDCLDVDGFSDAIASALVENGHVTTLADAFTLDVDTLKTLPMGTTSTGNVRVLGETTAKKIHEGIEKAKTQPLARVITALGIRMTGRGMSRRLAATFGSMDAILTATREDFINSGIDAVGPARAEAFVKGFAAMKDDVERMKALGFTMENPAEETGDTSAKPFAGMKVVVTGSVPGFTRTQAQEAVERLGATASGSVSKSVALVIVGEGAGSKEAKARDLGIRIMSAEEFAVLANS